VNITRSGFERRVYTSITLVRAIGSCVWSQSIEIQLADHFAQSWGHQETVFCGQVQ